MERFIHQKQKSYNVLLAELKENVFQILLLLLLTICCQIITQKHGNKINQYVCLLKFEMSKYLLFIVQQKRISCTLQLKLPLVHIHKVQHVRQRN